MSKEDKALVSHLPGGCPPTPWGTPHTPRVRRGRARGQHSWGGPRHLASTSAPGELILVILGQAVCLLSRGQAWTDRQTV